MRLGTGGRATRLNLPTPDDESAEKAKARAPWAASSEGAGWRMPARDFIPKRLNGARRALVRSHRSGARRP
jgi:hypothetical protein